MSKSESTYIKVIGQLTISGNVALIAEETINGFQKGSVIHTVTKSTYYKMRSPKQVRVLRSGRVESVIE
jgi:hypothetical protein